MTATIKEKYNIINKLLWILKFPEVALTIGTIIGFIAYIFGMINVYIPFTMLVIRVILFPIRLYIVNEKRKIERSNLSLVPKREKYVFKYG